jgi:GT2 family glycosyltransferase
MGHTRQGSAVQYDRDVISAAEPPFVRVVVINYDGGAVTRRCVDALLATEYPPDRLQVVVVDNASIDGLNWVLREEYPNVTLIESDVNEGFARGCNLAMRDLAGVDYLALINNDAIVPTNWLQPLLDAFHVDGARVGAVVPKLLLNLYAHACFLDPERIDPLADGRHVGVSVHDIRVTNLPSGAEIRFDERFFDREAPGSSYGSGTWSKGHASVWWPVEFDAPPSDVQITLSAVAPQHVRVGGRGEQVGVDLSNEPSRIDCSVSTPLRVLNSAGGGLYKGWHGGDRGFLEPDLGQYDTPCEVFSWCGGAVVLSADYLRDAGIFDPTYFLYYEDFDLAWRGRQLGWVYRYEPSVAVLHVHAYSSKAGSVFFNFWVNRNRRLTLVKNAPAGVAARAAVGFYAQPLRTLVRHVFARMRRLRPPSPTVVRNELEGIWSFTSALPSALAARRKMRRRRVVGDASIEQWMLTK